MTPKPIKSVEERPLCEVCGEPMPEGEEMFKYHGYSGNCPVTPKKSPEVKGVKDLVVKFCEAFPDYPREVEDKVSQLVVSLLQDVVEELDRIRDDEMVHGDVGRALGFTMAITEIKKRMDV